MPIQNPSSLLAFGLHSYCCISNLALYLEFYQKRLLWVTPFDGIYDCWSPETHLSLKKVYSKQGPLNLRLVCSLWWYIWLLKPRNPPFIEKSLFKTGPIKFKIGVHWFLCNLPFDISWRICSTQRVWLLQLNINRWAEDWS